jgi:hypothetical protein
MFAIYMHNHCNICNILIVLLQQISKTFATLEQTLATFTAYEMEACRHVEFTGGNCVVATINQRHHRPDRLRLPRGWRGHLCGR